MNIKNFDVIILGGGPAGLSAALYAGRGQCNTAIIDTSLIGGQPIYYQSIENYPGYLSLSSSDLIENMITQVEKYNVQLFPARTIKSVCLTSTKKKIETTNETLTAPVIIIATGAFPKVLNLPEEPLYRYKGLSYCAICDGMFYKNKPVAVIGGGNSALESALYLSRIASEVYLIHRREEYRADKVIQNEVLNNPKIKPIFNKTVIKILGDKKVEQIQLSDKSIINVNGLFPYIGSIPNSSLFKNEIELDSNNCIKVNKRKETSVSGVYAVGDVTDTPLKQVVTAVSDGAIAATYAIRYASMINQVCNNEQNNTNRFFLGI